MSPVPSRILIEAARITPERRGFKLFRDGAYGGAVMGEVEYRKSGEEAIKALLIASDRIHAFFVARFACGRGLYRDGHGYCESLHQLAQGIEIEMAASK